MKLLAGYGLMVSDMVAITGNGVEVMTKASKALKDISYRRNYRVVELEDICRSGSLSLESVKSIISQVTTTDVSTSSFFHHAVSNKNTTKEIVELLLDFHPNAASITTNVFCPRGESAAYPLHMACDNSLCPRPVIELLLKRCPQAINHRCWIFHEADSLYEGENKLLPIHYYLRRMFNIELETVKMLISDLALASGLLHDVLRHARIYTLIGVVKLIIENNHCHLTVAGLRGMIPLHVACRNKNMSSEIIKLLLNSWSESAQQRDNDGNYPLHILCKNLHLDESSSLNILADLVAAYPEALRHSNNVGYLPIHVAAQSKTQQFCKLLIGAFPESVSARNGHDHNNIPIHYACTKGRLDVVRYLLEVDREGINARTDNGKCPIHYAAYFGQSQVTSFLINQDPSCVSKTINQNGRRNLPLHVACISQFAEFETVKVLYNAYPEAIYTRNANGRLVTDCAKGMGVKFFLETQMSYALKAKDYAVMALQDGDGCLPLHHALRNNAPLGSIKLLVRGNPVALQTSDNRGKLPLHVGCEFETLDVVRYLVEPFESCLNVCDSIKDYPLHYACRGGKLDTVRYLLTKQIVPVSEKNANGKLPINLLWESCEQGASNESNEYVETVWQLLLAYPEIVNW